MPEFSIDLLADDPKFLALPDGAKRIVLSKRDSFFAKLSPAAQDIVIQRKFPISKLASMDARPGTDPEFAAKMRGAITSTGKTALRVGVPMVGGAIGAATPIPGGAAIGAGLASMGVSKTLGDPFRETVAQGITGALLPGPGKTIARGVIKGATLGATSETLSEVARSGHLPDKGQFAWAGIVGGLTGWLGTKWSLREAKPHIEEIAPKDVAGETLRVLEGKPSLGMHSEEVKEVQEIRKVITSSGRTVYLGRKGAGWSFVKAPKEAPPEPSSPFVGPPEPKPEARVRHFVGNPRWDADHIQRETGVPVYDDIFRPLEKAYAQGREATEAEAKRIENVYVRSNAPPAVKDYARSIVYAARNSHDGVHRALRSGIKHVYAAFGKHLTDEQASRATYHWISAPYNALLPFRVGGPIRVFSHTFQTGYMKLGNHVFTGLERAMTKKGMQEAVEGGALGPGHLTAPEEVLSNRGGVYDKILEKGYAGYRFAQDRSRAAIFHAAKAKAEEAIRVAKGNPETFARLSGLNIGVPNAEANNILNLYRAGRMKEVANEVGRIHSDVLIPSHSRLNRPFVTTESTPGQVLSQLSNWPLFYGSVLKNNIVAPSIREGAPKLATRLERSRMMARWIAANSVLLGASAAVLGQIEDPQKAWERSVDFTFIGPLLYGPGMGTQEWRGVVEGGRNVMHGKLGPGFREVGRNIPLPGRAAAQDLWWGYKKLLGIEE